MRVRMTPVSLLPLLLMVTVAGSPGSAAELSGVVRSADRTPLPGVTVTVTNLGTGASETTTSDAEGAYRIGDLAAGRYQLRGELSGFATGTRSIELDDTPRSLELTLRPGVAETITVTARKREESLIDVPISISTVSAADIEERAIAGFLETFETLPNVVAESVNSSVPGVTIRGITSSARIGFESGVGFHLDEIYLPRSQAVDKLLLDIERVEVLRGPQGSSYGKNTIGGVVNLVTTKPSSDTRGSIELAAGRYSLMQARGFLSGPLAGDKVSGKISLGVQQRDGWIEHRDPDRGDLMDEDSVGGRAQIRFTPSDRVNVMVTGDYADNDDTQSIEEVHSGNLFFLDGSNSDRSVAPNGAEINRREVSGGSVRAEVMTGRHLFTSITGYRTFDHEFFEDQDATSLDLVGAGGHETLDYFSQELRLSSTSGSSFSWLGGLFYSDKSQGNEILAVVGEGLLFAFGIPPIPGFTERVETLADIDEESFSGFFSGTWAFNDRASLGFGLRFSDETKDMTYRQDVFPMLGLVFAFAAPVAPTAQDLSDDEPSGDLSLVYELNPNVNGFVRLAHGFKAGGFSAGLAATSDPGDLSFSSEKVDAYEIGIKSFLADNRVRLNVSAFYLDQSDIQQEVWTGTQFIVQNAAEATSEGFELEMAASPASGFEIDLNLGYNDATFDKFVDPLLGIDFTGNRLIDAAEWTGSLGIQYYLPVSRSQGWFARAEANYRGDNPKSFDNNPLFAQQSHTLVNARTGFDFGGGRYTVAAWVKNLTDEDYSLGGFELLGTTYWYLNIPRTYAVELRLRM